MEEIMPIANTLACKIMADFSAEKGMGAEKFFVTLWPKRFHVAFKSWKINAPCVPVSFNVHQCNAISISQTESSLFLSFYLDPFHTS